MVPLSPNHRRKQAKWEQFLALALPMAPMPSSLPFASASATTARRSLWALALAADSLIPAAALAQSEQYILGPGSNVGPATKIKPSNCVTAADGSVTCDTKVVNPKGDTPARPQYSPFNN